MIKGIATIFVLIALGVSAGGCSKCGWIWDSGPRSCHSDRTQ